MAAKKIVEKLSNALLKYADDDKVTLSRYADSVIRIVTESQEKLVFGPRTYEIPKEDGALAFARACEVVLGDQLVSTPDTQVMTLETQDIVYEGYMTERQLMDKSIYSAKSLVFLAEKLGIEIPFEVESSRESLVKEICEKTEIVGVAAHETQAKMGIVRLYRDGKDFGLASLGEDNGNFTLMIQSTNEYEDYVNEVVRNVTLELGKSSIYKGRAYDYSRGKFINDLEFGTQDRIVLASDLSEQIRSRTSNRLNNDVRPILDSKIGAKKKSMVITNGEGGTGKTETARALGAWAIKNGRSFLTYMPDTVDIGDFQKFLDFANKVGPAFVLIEDIEKMVTDDPMQYSRILETLDGISSKSQEIDIWVNSNNANEDSDFFKNNFLRRFDVLFDFDQSNDQTIQGLFSVYLSAAGSDWELDGEVQYKSDLFKFDPNRVSDDKFVAHEKMQRLIEFVRQYEFKPWAIKQVVETSISYMVDRGDSIITEDHLLTSAKAVVKLNNLVKLSAGTPGKVKSIDSSIAGIIDARLEDHKVSLIDGEISSTK